MKTSGSIFASVTFSLQKSAWLSFLICDLGRCLRRQEIGLRKKENSEIFFSIYLVVWAFST